MSNYHYFSDEEVAQYKLEPELWAKLDMARGAAGIPFIITCGCRSCQANADLKGAVRDSAHLPDANGLSLAADIACGDDHQLCAMLMGLFAAGIRRIGIYVVRSPDDPTHFVPVHLHVDIDTTKPDQVTWIYLEQN